MKKVIVIVIATFLAIPSISLAGSASSRWDLTIGGFVKFDMGYSDKGVNADYITAPRDSYGLYENRNAEYSSLYAASGQSRLHFIVKGPEAFGGKTSGFVETDFRGLTGGGDYGELALRHAFMKIQWTNDSLLIGRFWNRWGNIGTHTGYLISYGGLIDALKGYRNEQIMWDHKLTKELSFFLAVEGNTTQDFGSRTLDGFANSPYPFFESGINYTSDACGMIGVNALSFEVGGFLGWERKIWDSNPAANISSLDDDLYTAWGAAIKGHIPIIPEKKGNKAGALGVSGTLFIAQNLGWVDNAGSSSYDRASDADGSQNFAYPHSWGGWFELDYWFTHQLSFHGWYSHRHNSYSDRFQNSPGASSVVKQNQQYILNISYDVNAAMRFGVEYAHVRTKYGKYLFNANGGIIGDNNGQMNTFRIGAWYFF